MRLFPTLWVCSVITLLVRFPLDHTPHGELIRDWLHSIVLAPWTLYWIDGSYWTLPIEVSFYTLIFLILVSGTYGRLGPVVSCIGLFSTAVAMYECAAAAGVMQHIVFADTLVTSADKPLVLILLVRDGLYFALGTQLWLFLFERRTFLRSLLIGVFVAGAIAEMHWHIEQFVHMMHDRHDYTPLPGAVPVLLWASAMVTIVVSVTANGSITRWLGPTGARVTRQLGLATYPIYLLHQNIGRVVLEHLHGRVPDVLTLCLLVLAVPCFCIFILPHIERPVQEASRGWLGLSKRQNKMPAATLP